MTMSRFDVIRVLEHMDAGINVLPIIVIRAENRQRGTGLISTLREVCFNLSRVELIDPELYIPIDYTGSQLTKFNEMIQQRSQQTTLVIVAYPEYYAMLDQIGGFLVRSLILDTREEPLPHTVERYLQMNLGNGRIEQVNITDHTL